MAIDRELRVAERLGQRLIFPCRPPELPDDHDVRELRLALVCYGGVSLAIYMHGITKELEKLVRASHRLVETRGGLNPFGENATEHAYYAALQQKFKRDGYYTRVIVDIISGTSAGGINGVCLAKAIAEDAPQDGLRDLWLKKGAIGKLLGATEVPVSLLPPLAGNRMLGWLRSAFADMEAKRGGTLLPNGLMLQLFVTTTDINGYAQRIPIADPKSITTIVNKVVFEFRHRDGVGNLDELHNPALGFSARATSSFPGAFAPTSIADIEPEDARAAFPDEFCRDYEVNGFDVTKTFFIDGGVLDNFPFRHAVRAIPGKPASTEVDRKLLFIEPDPAQPMQQPDGIPPSFKKTVWSGLSTLPRRQPIADAFAELRLYNQRVRELRQMTGALREQIFETIRPRLQEPYPVANQAINEAVIAANPFAFQSYLRLKLLSVVEGMAAALCDLLEYGPASSQALFVQMALLEWARRTGILDSSRSLSASQLAFLRTFDLGYGRRRLGFVITRANDFYGAQDREALNRLKHGMYVLRCRLVSVLDGEDAASIRHAAAGLFGEEELKEFEPFRIGDFVDRHADDLSRLRDSLGEFLDRALEGNGGTTYAELQRLAEELAEDVRDDICAHFLGFVFWDAAMYPARRVSGIVELDEVEVFRASPLDATRLPVPQDHGIAQDTRKLARWMKKHVLRADVAPEAPKGKLRGVKVAHFGAFFLRKWRENDYLWGRLDGAERLLRIIDEPDERFAKLAFRAIAADEKQKLRKAKDVIRTVEDYVNAP